MRGERSFVAAFLVAAVACGPGAPAKKSPIPAAYSNPATRPDDYAVRGPFLWEVVGDHGSSYLFGTIHAGISPDQGLTEVVRSKLSQSRIFIMEADLRAIDAREVTAMATLPSGQTLRQLVGEETWAALLEVVKAPFSGQTLETVRPWYAQVAVLQSLYPTPVSLDTQLLALAEAEGKELVFLEDWRFQLSMLDEVSEPADLADLVDADSRSRKMLDSMIAAYRAGDFEAMTEAALDPELVGRAPDKYRKMFDDRNRAWLEELRAPLARGRAFVAVGVGHFCGETGLVELLRADGFIVRRVAESRNRQKRKAATRFRTPFWDPEKPRRIVRASPIRK